MKAIEGVSKIKDGYNPATWMLEISSSAQEMALDVDFSNIYKNSDLFRSDKVHGQVVQTKKYAKAMHLSFDLV